MCIQTPYSQHPCPTMDDPCVCNVYVHIISICNVCNYIHELNIRTYTLNSTTGGVTVQSSERESVIKAVLCSPKQKKARKQSWNRHACAMLTYHGTNNQIWPVWYRMLAITQTSTFSAKLHVWQKIPFLGQATKRSSSDDSLKRCRYIIDYKA